MEIRISIVVMVFAQIHASNVMILLIVLPAVMMNSNAKVHRPIRPVVVKGPLTQSHSSGKDPAKGDGCENHQTLAAKGRQNGKTKIRRRLGTTFIDNTTARDEWLWQ